MLSDCLSVIRNRTVVIEFGSGNNIIIPVELILIGKWYLFHCLELELEM